MKERINPKAHMKILGFGFGFWILDFKKWISWIYPKKSKSKKKSKLDTNPRLNSSGIFPNPKTLNWDDKLTN